MDRIRASLGAQIRIGLPGRGVLTGTANDVGPDWILLVDQAGELVVALTAVLWVEGLRAAGRLESGPRWAVPDLRRVLRELTQSRSAVAVELTEGQSLNGTFAGVFADHADLACHPPEALPRAGAITAIRSIPLSALVTIRRYH